MSKTKWPLLPSHVQGEEFLSVDLYFSTEEDGTDIKSFIATE